MTVTRIGSLAACQCIHVAPVVPTCASARRALLTHRMPGGWLWMTTLRATTTPVRVLARYDVCGSGAASAAAAVDGDKVACHGVRAVGHLLALLPPTAAHGQGGAPALQDAVQARRPPCHSPDPPVAPPHAAV